MRSSSNASRPDETIMEKQNGLRESDSSHSSGLLSVVGIGPGSLSDMSARATAAIQYADVVVGYKPYLELINEMLENQEIVGTGMMQEIDRCQAAVEMAIQGKNVAVVSSGDPGIYGMAGLVLELVMKIPEKSRPKVEVIPGISALGAAAAVLGAPLMHDFAVISLSDLLTPWELIAKRAEMAAAADFVMILYNPKSTRRVDHIEKVQQLALQHRSGDTPVGIVRQASREGQKVTLSTLEKFTSEFIDMFSVVIIGNSQTYVCDGRMITPRGYQV